MPMIVLSLVPLQLKYGKFEMNGMFGAIRLVFKKTPPKSNITTATFKVVDLSRMPAVLKKLFPLPSPCWDSSSWE
jgi:hypothetical protein